MNRGHLSQDQAQIGGGDTLGSDEPAVDFGKDVEESDGAVAEVKSAAKKACLDVPGFRLKRHDMGDSADSRSVSHVMNAFIITHPDRSRSRQICWTRSIRSAEKERDLMFTFWAVS